MSAIREDLHQGGVDCSCVVPSIDPIDEAVTKKELIFSDFALSSVGQYSCRVPAGRGMFNTCRFDVLPAGEYNNYYHYWMLILSIQVDSTQKSIH